MTYTRVEHVRTMKISAYHILVIRRNAKLMSASSALFAVVELRPILHKTNSEQVPQAAT